MADLLATALRQAGHSVEIPVNLRSYSKTPDPERLQGLSRSAHTVREQFLADIETGRRSPPQLWFTYHPYYKAPDLVGPIVAEHLGIPYATAEMSIAAKRAAGPWAAWQQPALACLPRAKLHFCFTERDRIGLLDAGAAAQTLIDLPPFIDTAAFEALPREISNDGGRPIELIALAMMRSGRKLDSFVFLAEVLRHVLDLDWHLTLIGDGPQRGNVEQAYQSVLSDRVTWAGLMPHAEVPEALASADLYVWPGIGEAYGLAYLEAQAVGLPVIALDSGGVRAVLCPGETALLASEGDVVGYAAALRLLMTDAPLRAAMAEAARRFVLGERSIAQAARTLGVALAPFETQAERALA